jgi:hypothetical protein
MKFNQGEEADIPSPTEGEPLEPSSSRQIQAPLILTPLNTGHEAASVLSKAGLPISRLFPHSFCSFYLHVKMKR